MQNHASLPLLSSEESPEVAILAIAVVTKGADHQHCHDGTADEGNKAGSGDYKWDSNRETDAAYGKGRDERRQMWQARQEVFPFSRDGRQGRRERDVEDRRVAESLKVGVGTQVRTR